MTRAQRTLWLIAVTIIALLFTVASLSYIVTEPWHVLPDIGGDGAKNDLTYLYHSAYGKGYWFEGMNYPFGEHIVFTDGVPLLSVFFAATGNVSFPTALTTLWWLVGLSYLLSCIYLYQLLLQLTRKAWFAAMIGILISFLTPQMLAIRGHYALSFTCIIPMFFYWTYMYQKTRKWQYCAYVFSLGALSAFLHPYYAGMLLVWTGFYSLGYLITTNGRFKDRLLHVAKLFTAAAAAAIVVMVTLKVTDPIKDRPSMPFDPPENYAHIRQIFSSYLSPFWQYGMKWNIVPDASQGGEGFTYPGLVVIVVSLIALIAGIWRLIRKQAGDNRENRVWLILALGTLVFSMGIPFIWGMEWLKDYMPVFRQFRALGRFAWIFYYVIAVYAAVVMYEWYTKLLEGCRKAIGHSLMTIALLVWGCEVSGYIISTRTLAQQAVENYKKLMQTQEKNWVAFLEEHKFKKGDFQAFLYLRYFHIGTEKLWVGDGGVPMTRSSAACLQLQLPMINVMMSRSSWQQAKDQLKLMSGPYASKPVLAVLKDNRPFLLMCGDEVLSPDEHYLLAASEYIGTFSDCKVYACYPDRIVDNDILHAADVEEVLPYMDGQDTCIGENSRYALMHFDAVSSKQKLMGEGAMPCIEGRDSMVAVLPVLTADDSVLYEFSCWFLLARENYFSPEVKLDMLNEKGVALSTTIVKTAESTDSYDMWFRASRYFYIPAGCSGIRCTIINSPGPSYTALDELLIRPAESVVISTNKDGGVMVNGHVYKPKHN